MDKCLHAPRGKPLERDRNTPRETEKHGEVDEKWRKDGTYYENGIFL